MKTNTKTQRLLLTLIVTALAVSLASCAPAQPTDPIAIIQASTERYNAGDVDGVMEFYAEDAIVSDETGYSVGSQAIRGVVQEVVEQGIHFENSDIRVDGNVVTYTCHVFIGDQEIDTYTAVDVIKDGKIIFEGSVDVYRYDCDKDPSQAFCPGN